MAWWEIALYALAAVVVVIVLAGMIVYAALAEMRAIDRENEDDPTEHGGRPL